MNNVIFAKTRHHYVPYDDFYRLAELSGYPVRYLDEIDWRTVGLTVICPVKSPEWNDVIPYGPRSRIIWWNLERDRTDMPIMDMSNPAIPYYVNEVWASDPAYARSIGAKYVFLGGHRAFGSVDVSHKQYDIISLMYWSGRRQQFKGDFDTFRSADLSGGLWGDERHKRLMSSKLMVTAHQDDKPYSEPIRFVLAGCYALPLLSETCEDSGYWKAGENYLSVPIGSLASEARILIDHPVLLARIGAAAWRLVCVERDFKSQVEAAL